MSLLDRLAQPLSDSQQTTAEPLTEPALSDRLWTTKLVPFPGALEAEEDSLRRDSDDEDAGDARHTRTRSEERELEPLREGAEGALRKNALLIVSDVLVHMSTANVQDLVMAVMPPGLPPMGLEWVSDTSLVLVFATETSARSSFKYLTLHTPLNPLEPLVPIDALAIDASSPFTVRMALASDVKKKDAARSSEFYRNENQRRRSERGPYSRRPEPQYRSEGNGSIRDSGRMASDAKRYGGAGRRRGREDEQADLDRELDSWTTGTVGGRGGGRKGEERPKRDVADLDAEMEEWAKEREKNAPA